MRMSLTRRDFVGATTLAVIAGHAAARALELGVPAIAPLLASWRIGLVQSAPWDVDPNRIHEDMARNLDRMLETIATKGAECDWLAFNDCPLTGRAATIDPSGAQIDLLRASAERHACAVSFGCGAERSAMLIPSDGTPTQHGPLVTLHGRRIAIVSAAMTANESTRVTVDRALRQGAEALLIMSSGPSCDQRWIADVAAGLPRLHVSAACETPVPGHTVDWLGGTQACDAHGLTLGQITHAEETMLKLSLQFAA